jgi:hypothetical protein
MLADRSGAAGGRRHLTAPERVAAGCPAGGPWPGWGPAGKRRGDASVSAPVPEGPASSQPSASKAPPEASQTNVSAPVAMMSPQEHEFRTKLKELREHLIGNADYVGRRFPEEARKMHYGEIEHRSVYGEATPDQAKELHAEGIEFHPLPILPDEWN